MLKIDKNGKLDVEELKKTSTKHISPPKNKNNEIKFNVFAKTLGSSGSTQIATKLGLIKIRVHSQFWKMLSAKENRMYLIMDIKATLKKPLLIFKDKDSIFFFNSFKKRNGELLNMVSVCAKVGDDIV